MRVLIAVLTSLFLLVGTVGVAGGIFGLFTTGPSTFPEIRPAMRWNPPDALSLCNSALQILFSLLLMTAAVAFAKTCWPEPKDVYPRR